MIRDIAVDSVTRKMKELFGLGGAYSPKLEDTIVPVVVVEQFRLSDVQRGPVEAIWSGSRTGTGIVGAWFSLRPLQTSTTADPTRPVVQRVRRITVAAGAASAFVVKIVPSPITVTAVAPLQPPIWQDRRFSPSLPALECRHQDGIVATLPAGGVEIYRTRLLANTVHTFEPETLILTPGHNLVAFIAATSTLLEWSVAWDELDADQTSLLYR